MTISDDQQKIYINEDKTLSDVAATELCDHIKYNRSLKALYINSPSGHTKTDEIAALALQHSDGLLILDLSNNQFENGVLCEELVTALANSKTLTSLSLHNCGLERKAVDQMVTILNSNSSIIHLDVAGNNKMNRILTDMSTRQRYYMWEILENTEGNNKLQEVIDWQNETYTGNELAVNKFGSYYYFQQIAQTLILINKFHTASNICDLPIEIIVLILAEIHGEIHFTLPEDSAPACFKTNLGTQHQQEEKQDFIQKWYTKTYCLSTLQNIEYICGLIQDWDQADTHEVEPSLMQEVCDITANKYFKYLAKDYAKQVIKLLLRYHISATLQEETSLADKLKYALIRTTNAYYMNKLSLSEKDDVTNIIKTKLMSRRHIICEFDQLPELKKIESEYISQLKAKDIQEQIASVKDSQEGESETRPEERSNCAIC